MKNVNSSERGKKASQASSLLQSLHTNHINYKDEPVPSGGSREHRDKPGKLRCALLIRKKSLYCPAHTMDSMYSDYRGAIRPELI